VPAFVPTLLNVSMIVFALFLTPYFDPPVMALGWAVLAGGLAQLLYQLPHLKKIGMLVLPRLNLRDTGVWRVMKQMLPAILGVSVSQISLIINTIFASFLVAGSVSWMYYADRLMELPSGVLGVALGTILLPTLAKTYANKDRQSIRGSSTGACACASCWCCRVPGAGDSGRTADRFAVPVRQFSAFDAAMTQRADRLFGRSARDHRDQSAGAGLLCATEHPHAGENRNLHAGRHAVVQPGADRSAGSRRSGAGDQCRCLPQCRVAVLSAAQAADVSAATGLGLFGFKLVVAVAVMSACAAGHALHAGLGSGHMLERFLRLGAGGCGCGGVFRDVAAARFPSARLSIARPWAKVSAAIKRAGRRFVGSITLGTVLPVVAAGCGYNRPLYEQEARYAAGSRSPQPAPPASGLRRHYWQL
jgi:putative peptidoglycan lipid II flippase